MSERRTSEWETVALARLVRVLGERAGVAMAVSVKAELGLSSIGSAAELRAFGDALQRRGGFAGAVGGLLQVHAAIHDDGKTAS